MATDPPESYTVISRAPLTISGDKYSFGDVLDGVWLHDLWGDRAVQLQLMIGTIEVSGTRPDPRLLDPRVGYATRQPPLRAVPDPTEAESRAVHPTAQGRTQVEDRPPARDVVEEVDLDVDDDGVGFDPGAATAVEVEAWVDDHPEDLPRVIELEELGKQRKVLLQRLRRLQAGR